MTEVAELSFSNLNSVLLFWGTPNQSSDWAVYANTWDKLEMMALKFVHRCAETHMECMVARRPSMSTNKFGNKFGKNAKDLWDWMAVAKK